MGGGDSQPATLKAEQVSPEEEPSRKAAAPAAVDENESLRMFTVCADAAGGDAAFESNLGMDRPPRADVRRGGAEQISTGEGES
jgi:hypothetical protein